MRKLKLVGQTEPASNILSEKERLIQDIREFVGPGGCVSFEHGFNPTFNMCAIDETQVLLRNQIGREHRHNVPLDELDEQVLKNIIIDIFRYQNYCRLRARQFSMDMNGQDGIKNIISVIARAGDVLRDAQNMLLNAFDFDNEIEFDGEIIKKDRIEAWSNTLEDIDKLSHYV